MTTLRQLPIVGARSIGRALRVTRDLFLVLWVATTLTFCVGIVAGML